jgi:hypothetical protein
MDNNDSHNQSIEKGPESGRIILGLAAKKEADLVHFSVAKQALLYHLMLDTRVNRLFDAWDERTGALEAAIRVSELLDKCANLLGYADTEPLLRSHPNIFHTGVNITLTKIPDDSSKDDRTVEENSGERLISLEEEDVRIIEETVRELNMAFRKFAEIENRLNPEQMTAEVISLVKDELKVPIPSMAPWLVKGLIERWDVGTHLIAINRAVDTMEIKYALKPPKTPQISELLETNSSEDVTQNYTRLRQQADELLKKLKAAEEESAIPNGIVTNPEKIRRYTEWFYRNHFRGESIRKIAMKDFPDKEDHRGIVRYGIGEIRRLFELVAYVEDPWQK